MGPAAETSAPTAHASEPETADTLSSSANLGAENCFQALPFQCRIKAPFTDRPTTQTLPDDVAETEFMYTNPPATRGAVARAQDLPFQWMMSGWLAELRVVLPTAHALLADSASTAVRFAVAGPGLGTFFQPLPFQCTVSGPVYVAPLVVAPTAQALDAELADTPSSAPKVVKPVLTAGAAVVA